MHFASFFCLFVEVTGILLPLPIPAAGAQSKLTAEVREVQGDSVLWALSCRGKGTSSPSLSGLILEL